MQLEVRGKTYHIEVHQHHEGLPLLVLLHGFMGSGEVFTHLVPDLKKFANPVTIDLLGHGSTEGDPLPERYNLYEQTEDLFTILHNFHPDPVFLHGYSMGGRLALHYALAFPNTIRGLILESTTWGIDDAGERAERQKLDEQRARAIEADYKRFLNFWTRLPLFDNGIDVPASRQNRYEKIQQSQMPSSMSNSLIGFGTGVMPSAKSGLDKLDIPVLILAGEADDRYCSLAKEMDQMIPDSRASIIERAGHRIHMENPGAFLSELESFIEQATKTRKY